MGQTCCSNKAKKVEFTHYKNLHESSQTSNFQTPHQDDVENLQKAEEVSNVPIPNPSRTETSQDDIDFAPADGSGEVEATPGKQQTQEVDVPPEDLEAIPDVAAPGDESLLEAIKTVKQAIDTQIPAEKKLPFLQVIPSQSVSHPEFIPVHPQISKIHLFEEEAILDDDVYTPSYKSLLSKVQSEKKVCFDSLLSQNHSERLVLLVGAAGSGKTTTSIRLAKKFNKDSDKLCFRLDFRELGYNEKLTLQELLLNPLHLKNIIKFDTNVSREDKRKRISEIKEKVYTWTEENDKHVLLIIDGYDQFVHGIKQVPPRKNSESRMKVADLIASLCNGYFLDKCQVILTSRSHALYSLPKELKEKATTYLLHDLSDEDMKTLLKQFTGDDKYDDVLHALETKAPHLKAICHNPLLLQMYVAAALTGNPKDITSMTRIFKMVVENLRKTKHQNRGLDDKLNEDLLKRLCEVAYKAILTGSVLISEELLTKHKLSVKQVQDFIFMVPGSNKIEKLVDGEHQLFFSHQTLQEYFAARYVWKYMSDDDFESFVKEKLCHKNWFVVAQFVCGMVVGIKESGAITPGTHPKPATTLEGKQAITPGTHPKPATTLEGKQAITPGTHPKPATTLEGKQAITPGTHPKPATTLEGKQAITPGTHPKPATTLEGKQAITPGTHPKPATTLEGKQAITPGTHPKPATTLEGKQEKASREKLIVIRLEDEMAGNSIDFDLLNVCALVRECQNEDVADRVAKVFPQKIFQVINTPSEGHALGCLLKERKLHLEELHLHGVNVPFLNFLKEVKEIKGTIGKLWLDNHSFEGVNDDFFTLFIDTLPKITDELKMVDWLASKSEAFIVKWINKFQQSFNVLKTDKNPKVVFQERVDRIKSQAKCNYDVLVEKLHQFCQVEEKEDKFIHITLTQQQHNLS